MRIKLSKKKNPLRIIFILEIYFPVILGRGDFFPISGPQLEAHLIDKRRLGVAVWRPVALWVFRRIFRRGTTGSISDWFCTTVCFPDGYRRSGNYLTNKTKRVVVLVMHARANIVVSNGPAVGVLCPTTFISRPIIIVYTMWAVMKPLDALRKINLYWKFFVKTPNCASKTFFNS